MPLPTERRSIESDTLTRLARTANAGHQPRVRLVFSGMLTVQFSQERQRGRITFTGNEVGLQRIQARYGSIGSRIDGCTLMLRS